MAIRSGRHDWPLPGEQKTLKYTRRSVGARDDDEIKPHKFAVYESEV